MENGVDRGTAHASTSRRAGARDGLGAIALAEGAVAERVFVAIDAPLSLPPSNAFGDPLTVERGPALALAQAFADAAAAGKRTTLVAHARDLAVVRPILEHVRARRIGTVVHVLTDHGAGDAMPLSDLGWGLLFAAGVEEELDLTLVARRAAEDSGTPFFVVHERGSARHVEALAPPLHELVDVFVGAPSARVRAIGDAAHPVHAKVTERAFAERVPFALSSAMRELESLTGRRRDVLERIPAGEAAVTIVALGELGESVVEGVERLRFQGQDVGALRIVALRPFPGPRLVKAVARGHAITVLETTDEPLAQSCPLAREVKAAFADAITWAPDYPGVGRVPRILSGVVGLGESGERHELEARDLDAVLGNMHADERGKRSFVLGTSDLDDAPGASASRAARATLSVRGHVRDGVTAEACAELCAAVVSSTLGLRVRASVRRASAVEGAGFVFDLLASRDRPRGAHAPHAVRLIALEEAAMLGRGNPLARLAEGGALAVPSRERSADAVWGEVPAYAKAIVFDRGGRVIGWQPAPEDGDPAARPWLVAAAFAGLALAAGTGSRGAVDSSLVAREVEGALRVATGASREAWAARGADAARRAFEAHVEVPRATVERDQEAIRLGRRDARASEAPPPK